MPCAAHTPPALVPQVPPQRSHHRIPPFTVFGSCWVKSDGCVYSDNFGLGQEYSDNQDCFIFQNTQFRSEPFPLDVRSFDVEASQVRSFDSRCAYDFLEVNGVKYCGKEGPQGVTPAARSRLVWHTDWSVSRAGFKICAPRTRYRLRITTGTSTFDDGTLDVEVDDGSGYASVITDGVNWAREEVVLDASYHTLLGVRVRNPATNGWIGAIEYSLDDGVTYTPFVCTDCTKGYSTARIAVDGDSDFSGPTTCLDGATCTLAPN